MSSLPSGTVTFLFTDIEGSTHLAQEYPAEMSALLGRHNEILNRSIQAEKGYVFQIIGDAFCAAFFTASDALKAALLAQRLFADEAWDPAPIKVRMGIHTGAAQVDENDDRATSYSGYLTLTRVQRIMSIAHGGQILLSNATAELARCELPEQVLIRDMGLHRLKGLISLDHLWQVVAPGLPDDFPPLNTLGVIPNNLPRQLTSFVGRENEMAEIKQALAGHRLVTLTGTGGVGKSRISLQVAGDSLDQFPDGIWFVELAPLAEPNLIPQTILAAARIQPQQGFAALDTLIDFLGEKTSLLVLDNCEHLIDACAMLVESLLQAALKLKIIASSREALRVTGEYIWYVPSLSLPELKKPPPYELLAQFEAVRLFVDRALLVQPHFVLTKENVGAVVKICHRLDGIPLALELAAARLRSMSAEQIAGRLDDRFRLLTGGSRTALPRQQTLRALIDWSYNLLSEQEKFLLRRLAVFAGGWTLEAAETVCSGEGIEPENVLDLLAHLVDKSLVILVNHGNELRYRRLETIRQYAQEKLYESSEGATYRDRHMAYFLNWVEELTPGLRGPEQVELLNRLENEIDNLRAALEWSQGSDSASGLQLASMLKWFWHFCGLFEEGAGWLEDILASNKQSGAEIDPLLQARALFVLAWLSYWSGNVQTSMSCATESLNLCQKHPGPIADGITADNYYMQSVSAFRIGGDLSQAKQLLEKSLALYQALGDLFGVAEISSNLYGNALFSGDLEKASYWNRTAIQIRKELGDKDGLAYDLTIGAAIPISRLDFQTTKRTLTEAVEACKQARYEFDLVLALGMWGITCLLEDNPNQATDYFLQVVTLAYEKSNAIFKTLSLYYLVLLLFKKKQYRASVQLYGAMEGLKTYNIIQIFDIPIVHESLQEASLLHARETLGEVEFDAAYARGQTMTLDPAIAFAMSELGV